MSSQAKFRPKFCSDLVELRASYAAISCRVDHIEVNEVLSPSPVSEVEICDHCFLKNVDEAWMVSKF